MLLGALIWLLDGIELGTYDGNALWIWYGKPIGTTIVNLYGLTMGTYDGTYIGWS